VRRFSIGYGGNYPFQENFELENLPVENFAAFTRGN
jgi:hypothetical protein